MAVLESCWATALPTQTKRDEVVEMRRMDDELRRVRWNGTGRELEDDLRS